MTYRWSPRWGAGAVVLSAALLAAACSGNDVLAPPDGTACTLGSIAPGDSVKGELKASSCQTFSDMGYENVWFQSWTLQAKAHTAYVVRLNHVVNADSIDNWAGDLYAYQRNDHGDAEWATGWYNQVGSTNGNGGYNEELYLATTAARTISLRVQVNDTANVGAYTLTVTSCPYVTIDPSVSDSIASLDMTKGCLVQGWSTRPTRFSFIGFPADSLHDYLLHGSILTGGGTAFAHISGPDLDLGCYIDSCTWSHDVSGAPTFSLNTTTDYYNRPFYPALQTLMLGVDADSAGTAQVFSSSAPVPAPRYRPAGRPFGLRPR